MSCHQEDPFVFHQYDEFLYTFTIDQCGNKTTQTDETLYTKLEDT